MSLTTAVGGGQSILNQRKPLKRTMLRQQIAGLRLGDNLRRSSRLNLKYQSALMVDILF